MNQINGTIICEMIVTVKNCEYSIYGSHC